MNNRIGYIDAMRGLAMIFVVIGHVFIYSFYHLGNPIMKVLNEEIEVPLFFMVSGFLVKVPKNGFWSYLGNKAFQLCVPAVIVMSVYMWATNTDFTFAWVNSYKIGYWFTFTLFYFFVIYTVLKYIFQALKLNQITQTTLLIIISIFLLYASVWCLREEFSFSWIPLFGLIHFRWFIYFIIGTLIAEYKLLSNQDNHNNILTNRRIIVGVIVLSCFILHIYTYKDGRISYIGSSTLWLTVTTLSGVFVILMGFLKYKSWSESRIGNILQTIGRYSLDVYFLHYFFLPSNLKLIGDWFKINPNPIIEYTMAIAIATVLIAASLIVGRIIRLSPMLAHWLLAAKK